MVIFGFVKRLEICCYSLAVGLTVKCEIQHSGGVGKAGLWRDDRDTETERHKARYGVAEESTC